MLAHDDILSLTLRLARESEKEDLKMVFKKSDSMDQRLKCMVNMPPLYNKLPNESFSFEKSEVMKWLSQQPQLIEYLFSVVSRKGFIKYNPQTQKWQGVDWEDDGYDD